MKAHQLCAELRKRLPEIANHVVAVGDQRNLAGKQVATIHCYNILRTEVDPSDCEVCLHIRFPDDGVSLQNQPTVTEFLDTLGPIGSDYPEYDVVACVELEIEVEGEEYSRFDLPISGLGRSASPPLVILPAAGFDMFESEEVQDPQ